MQVPAAIRNKRTVAEALVNNFSITDLRGRLDAQVSTDYLAMWGLLHNISTTHGQEDAFKWRWESSGQYTSRSAYKVVFHGSVNFA